MSDIIKARSPMRLSFVGGGLDFPHWFNYSTGKVISSTIAKYAYCTLVPREDSKIKIISVDLNEILSGNIEHKFDNETTLKLATATINRFNFHKGFDLYLQSDAPPGSGLGGSSAIISAVLSAVCEFVNCRLGLYEHAQMCYEIEREDLGISGGYQDQYATTFGGFNYIEFNKNQIIVNPLRLQQEIIYDLESIILFCHVGHSRANDNNLIEYQINKYKTDTNNTEKNMSELAGLVDEFKTALLYSEINKLGEILNKAFVAKKGINPLITKDTNIDGYLKTALDNGAFGGKLCGAGGGGYLILFVPLVKQKTIKEKLSEMGCHFEPIRFTRSGAISWKSKIL